MKKYNKGFTLIELLVVIAIIGILAGIILVSLNGARNKGKDAAIKSEMASLRPQAEIFYDDNSGSYAGFCTTGDTTIKTKVIADAGGSGTADYACYDASSAWAASVKLTSSTSTNHYCVDSTGASKEIGANGLDSNVTACQ